MLIHPIGVSNQTLERALLQRPLAKRNHGLSREVHFDARIRKTLFHCVPPKSALPRLHQLFLSHHNPRQHPLEAPLSQTIRQRQKARNRQARTAGTKKGKGHPTGSLDDAGQTKEPEAETGSHESESFSASQSRVFQWFEESRTENLRNQQKQGIWRSSIWTQCTRDGKSLGYC